MKTRKIPTPAMTFRMVGLCLALALLVSAAPPADMDPLQALPAGALFVASAGNPGRVLANALAFSRKAGLTELETALATVLTTLDGKGDLPDELVQLAARMDWSRRLVVAIYAPEAESRPGLLAYIPADNPPAAQQAILQAAEATRQRASTSLALPGYVMVAMGMEAPASLDFELADVSALAAYPESSIATWVDVAAGKDHANLLDQGLSSIFGSGDPENTDSPGDEGAAQEYELPETWEEEPGQDFESEEVWDGDWDWDTEDWDAPVDRDTLDQDTGDLDSGDLDSGDWDGDWDWDIEDWDTGNLETGGWNWDAGNLETDDWSPEDQGTEVWSDSPVESMATEWDGLAGTGNLASMVDSVKGMMEGFLEILKDIRSMDIGLIVEADRVWVRSGTNVGPGGTLYRMSTEAASGQLPLPYLSYLEMDALFSMVWSTKIDWPMDILETLYGFLLPDEALLRKVLDAMKASKAATGLNGAVNFDLRLSDELASAIKAGSLPGEEAIPLLGRGLDFDITGVMELADRQGFRDALRQSMALVDDPAYQAIMKDNGLGIQVSRRVGRMDGLPYDQYEYEMRSSAGGNTAEAVLDIFNTIVSPLLSPVHVYRNDKAYLGFGKPENLRPLLGRDRAARPLQSAPHFRALRAGAPADTRGLLYLSTGTLMRRIMQILPEDRSILPIGYGDLYGFLGWFSASPGRLGFGLGLGAEDIKAFRSLPD